MMCYKMYKEIERKIFEIEMNERVECKRIITQLSLIRELKL